MMRPKLHTPSGLSHHRPLSTRSHYICTITLVSLIKTSPPLHSLDPLIQDINKTHQYKARVSFLVPRQASHSAIDIFCGLSVHINTSHTHTHTERHKSKSIQCPPLPQYKTTTTPVVPAQSKANTHATHPSHLYADSLYEETADVVATEQYHQSHHQPAVTRHPQQSRSPQPTRRSSSSWETADAARHVC